MVLDGLTGVHRRDPGLLELDREVTKAHRTGTSFVLAFVDVDGLKGVNDAKGHAAGDQLLCDVVDAIRRVVRQYDLVVRYGGDEFVCGLLDIDLAGARQRSTSPMPALGRPMARVSPWASRSWRRTSHWTT